MNPKNVTCFTGRLTRDPSFKKTKEGKEFSCLFIIAVQRNIPNQKGEYISDFIPIRYEGIERMKFAHRLCKGDTIIVSGSFRGENYSVDGKSMYSTYILADQIEFDVETSKKKYKKGTEQNDIYNSGETGEEDSELPY